RCRGAGHAAGSDRVGRDRRASGRRRPVRRRVEPFDDASRRCLGPRRPEGHPVVTDVLTRPQDSAGAAPAEAPQPVGDWARERTSRLDVSDVAALALTAVTATAAIGLGRLFKDGSFVLPLLVAVAVTH